MSKPTTPQVSIEMAVNILRGLSFHDRLKVVSIVLPEMERECPQAEIDKVPLQRESLRGLWKHFHIDLSAEDIDEVRKEVWKNFPREDIL